MAEIMSSTSVFSIPPIHTKSKSSKHSPALSPERLKFLIDKSKSIKQLQQIHAFLIRHNLDCNQILRYKLQRSYSSLGHLKHSFSVFKSSQTPDVFSYTSIIHSHASNNLHQQALLLYIEMLTLDIEPNPFTFSAILKSCPLNFAEPIHGQAIKLRCDGETYVRTSLVDVYASGGDLVSAHKLFDTLREKNLVSFTAMIKGYSKNGELDKARELFDGMKERDTVCWSSMIDGYTQHGRPNDALALFRRMLVSNAKPSELTVVAVLSACGQVGALESGRWVHAYVKNNFIQINAHVGTALIDMYSKCGSLEDAKAVFKEMKVKDVVAWNSMIVGYAMHGFSQEALELFQELIRLKLQPTDITYVGVLNACANAGLINEGWGYFRAMKSEYGIEPKIEHYGCMVNLLGRKGHLEEAYNLTKTMKIDPDPVIWGALLDTCRTHKDIGLGEEIVKFLAERNLADSGTYVLLSNIYAASGDWDGTAKVRAMMKRCGVEKEPGCSSIEVNNKVHEFLAGDKKHPKSKEIYAKLEEMNAWLEAHGHAPHIDMVLHDMEEAEKQRSLAVHSEKLAIAFGLISTKPGTTIKIFKNLRFCQDCHAVTKLVSKITGRRLVVRDRNRFHHFVDGSCSCGDFW